MNNARPYLGESNKRCRFWPDCDNFDIPSVQTDMGFYCFRCAENHPDPDIRQACIKAKKYRKSLAKEERKITGRKLVDIDARKKQILEFYKRDSRMSIEELAAALSLSRRTISNYLSQLRRDGIILIPDQRRRKTEEAIDAKVKKNR